MTMIISGSTGLEFPDGSDQTTAFTSNSPTFTGTVAVQALTASGNVNFDSNTLFVDSVNNEVGIGTSSPSSKFHVRAAADVNYGVYNDTTILRTSAFNDAFSSFIDWQFDASSYRFRTASTERMRLDSSGNLGLGVTPSAWSNTFKILDINTTGFVGGSASSANIGENAYFDGTHWRYKTTSEASYYAQLSAEHRWHIAPSGTAGNIATFTQAMTLDASGRLLVGTTSYLTSSSGAVPALQSASTTASAGGCFLQNATANNIGAPAIYSTKTRSGTVGNYSTAVINGDFLMFIDGEGSDGVSSLRRAGSISINAAETFTTTSSAGYITFNTTASGAVNTTERLRIGSAGQIGIGGANYGTSGQVLTSGGSGAAPSWGAVTLPTGTIKQVVSATQGSVTSTSSSSYVDISGMSVTITPSSASNKIWIIVSMGGAAAGGITDIPVLRNGSTIGNVPFTFYDNGDGNTIQGASYNYLDSPATTSAVTYKLQWRNQGGTTTYLNANRSGGGNTRTSSITVMEVVG